MIFDYLKINDFVVLHNRGTTIWLDDDTKLLELLGHHGNSEIYCEIKNDQTKIYNGMAKIKAKRTRPGDDRIGLVMHIDKEVIDIDQKNSHVRISIGGSDE